MHVPLDPCSKTLDPLSVLLHGLGGKRCKPLQGQNSQAETNNISDAGKSTPWPGATPFCPRFSGPKRTYGFRVAPGHTVPPRVFSSAARFAIRNHAATSCQNCLQDRCTSEDLQHSSSMLSPPCSPSS